MIRLARSRLIALLIVVATLLASSPAYAGSKGGTITPLSTTGVTVSPNPYDPTSGQSLTVYWSYDTVAHSTLITVSGPMSLSYLTYGSVGLNSFSFGSPQWPDGYYTITVAPNDEWSSYSGSTGLFCQETCSPAPAAASPSSRPGLD